MQIAIIASGNVGGALGRTLKKQGHTIVFGVREPQRSKFDVLKAEFGSEAFQEVQAATQKAEVVILTTPWEGAQEALESAGDLSGKILIDATNPVSLNADIIDKGLLVGHTASGAEMIATWVSKANVVKAFNTTGWHNMQEPTGYAEKPSMFLCGDNAEAKTIVSDLINNLGFEAIDCGNLKSARLLEPAAMLWIHLAFGMGHGTDIALKLMKK